MIKKNKSKHSNEIGKKSVLRQIWQNKMAYLLLSPLIIGLLITCYYPPISGLYHSFFDWNVTGSATFIELDNFKELFSDPVFAQTDAAAFTHFGSSAADYGGTDFLGQKQKMAV